MSGLNGQRVYLDWNATAPLRPEARAAMLEGKPRKSAPKSKPQKQQSLFEDEE